MTSTTQPAPVHLDDLRDQLDGRLVLPDDAEYDALRRVMTAEGDPRPAALVRVAGPRDVARVIAYARSTGTDLAVRAGGHSGAGHSTVDGGIVIDLRDLRELTFDEDTGTVWAGAGLTAGEVSGAAAERGLAIGFGDTASVGIGGITLGGGVGYLVRKHGLTIDNLLAAEVVTADGEVLEVDADRHPDLFWALRGGGGNFGVVTRFRYRLHPLGQVVGGILVLPATVETISGFMAAAEAAPDELSAIGNVMNCPPMPFVDEAHHGSMVIMAMLCHAGDADAGERAMAPFRALAEPLADLLAPMDYTGLFPPEDPDYHPTAASTTMFVDHVGPEEAALILERAAWSDAPMRGAQLRALGGAMARVAPDATAFAHRRSRVMVNLFAFYEGEADRVVKEAWIRDLAAALHQGDDGAYVNFLGDEGPDRVRAAYPGATWERLAAVKARYDPDNLFRRNQNVPPAA